MAIKSAAATVGTSVTRADPNSLQMAVNKEEANKIMHHTGGAGGEQIRADSMKRSLWHSCNKHINQRHDVPHHAATHQNEPREK